MALLDGSDTIFAVASGAGRTAISVIRISGPACRSILKSMVGRIPVARHATLSAIRSPGSTDILDRGLVLWFPGPASFTGEDCIEFQVHGGKAVVASIISALGQMAGLRPSEPGEFTRRAFLNHRLDLTQVEALADLIDSETEHQRRQAIRQLDGALGQHARHWRGQLVRALALIEAEIDFVEEDDAPQQVVDQVCEIVAAVNAEIRGILNKGPVGERLRDGLTVVLAGRPNVGKSSLFNHIAGREAAIVSPLAGTTRDIISVNIDIAGYPVQFFDTAGMRRSKNLIENMGISKAKKAAQDADLVLWLFDSGSKAQSNTIGGNEVWYVKTKSDLGEAVPDLAGWHISSNTGQGVDELLAAIGTFAHERFGGGETHVLTRERHRLALAEVSRALEHIKLDGLDGQLELIGEDLRVALKYLGKLVGEVGVEEILGEIFSTFCIGK